MHHIKQSDLTFDLRRDHVREFRRRIKDTLRYGGHSEEHRKFLEYQLLKVEGNGVYLGEPPRPPGAIDGKVPVKRPEITLEGASYEYLNQFRMTDLIEFGKTLGLNFEQTTKAGIIQRLLEATDDTERRNSKSPLAESENVSNSET